MYLITGANGFLGRALTAELSSYETLSRTNADYCVDLATTVPQLTTPPEMVIHAAGKAHAVPKTPQETQAFFDVNLTGTKNLVAGLERLPNLPRAFVFISTVAVYGLEEGVSIAETAPLKGATPYADSKRQAEDFLEAWGRANGVEVSILRLPLLIGRNPPGNLRAMIQGISRGRYLRIGKGEARKSVLLAADIASILPALSRKGGTYNLTDGHHPRFADIEAHICQQLGKSLPASIPLSLAKLLGHIGDKVASFPVNSGTIRKITSDLTFDDTKARRELGWRPRTALNHFEVTL